MTARVASVNVGRPRPVDTGRRVVGTAIWKRPVAGRVAVRGVNVDGDDQADRTVHGGPDKAVYAYALEEIRQWEDELGRPLGAAAFGENLTTETSMPSVVRFSPKAAAPSGRPSSSSHCRISSSAYA